jgi:hypothetical protein
MNNEAKFPQALLKRPWEERLEYFNGRKIVHNKMETIAADILSAIRRRAGQGFIFVVGPTRIGKTTVLEYVVNKLLTEAMDEMLNNPGCIPVASMETSAYPRGYDWKDHWVGCLEALNEPLINHKVAREESDLRIEQETRAFIRESKTGRILRRAFQTAAKQRKLRVFCIDEAHHLTLVPYSRMYRAQLEIIKSVASLSKAMHVLFGTYDLLKLRNASGQLGSRAVTVHFSRYRPDSNADLKDFANTLLSLVAHMPFYETPDLSKDLDYCFDTSLGCIGLLKVWLMDALGAALERGQKTLSRRDLEKYEPPMDVLEGISMEIVKGEKKLKQDEQKRSLIRLRMLKGSEYEEPERFQMSLGKGQEEPINRATESSNFEAPPTEPTHKQGLKKGRRVERKPKRDKVGGGRKKRAA